MSEFTSVTRCPYCRTSFHLGPLQLHAAGGKVRCGACLNIFDARAHFLVEQKYLFDAPLPEQLAAQEQLDSAEQAAEPELLEELLPDEAGENLADIYPVMMPGPEVRPASRLWGWVALLLVLILPAQLFWWQPEPLLSQSWYRSFLRDNCHWLPCQWTDFQNLDYLSLTGLIQPSTTHNQVLTALIELRNQAPLPQPFPALSLRFMNIRGDLVSARVFRPEEYLQSEASGRQFLESDQRVQIELDIYDPGGEAVSYEFEPLFPSPRGQP